MTKQTTITKQTPLMLLLIFAATFLGAEIGIVQLFQRGVFNFGIQGRILGFESVPRQFLFSLVTDAGFVFCSAIYYFRLFKGKETVLIDKIVSLKSELLLCYGIVLFLIVIGRWVSEFACVFVPLALILLSPITAVWLYAARKIRKQKEEREIG